mmetsp:Transcript_1480/g.4030  ORF Transcript_1480/g.4030 Transcript_1480/m.4030 type:complete len:289 (+) Transcript_1480:219-1085(+)
MPPQPWWHWVRQRTPGSCSSWGSCCPAQRAATSPLAQQLPPLPATRPAPRAAEAPPVPRPLPAAPATPPRRQQRRRPPRPAVASPLPGLHPRPCSHLRRHEALVAAGGLGAPPVAPLPASTPGAGSQTPCAGSPSPGTGCRTPWPGSGGRWRSSSSRRWRPSASRWWCRPWSPSRPPGATRALRRCAPASRSSSAASRGRWGARCYGTRGTTPTCLGCSSLVSSRLRFSSGRSGGMPRTAWSSPRLPSTTSSALAHASSSSPTRTPLSTRLGTTTRVFSEAVSSASMA